MRIFITFFFCCTVVITGWSQTKSKRDKFPSYFGVVIAPVIPNDFIGARETIFQDSTQTMTTNFINKWGYTFGGVMRIGLTKTFSIETGISQVHRNYNVAVNIPDSSYTGVQKLSFVNYDIPINGLAYVQLSEQWFMNASMGISINHYPTDVRDSLLPGPGKRISLEGRRTERTYFSSNVGLGFEFRTEKAGTFYLGGSAKVPFKPILFGVSVYRESGSGNTLVGFRPITAGYFTIDFRYFIPTPKKRNNTYVKGPNE